MLQIRWIVFSALIAYGLPWVVNTGSALTLNAYDLAEWLSLHPAVRSGSMPLIVTFALRVLPMLIVTIVVFDQNATLIERLAVPFIVALALLPPLDFFRSGLNDPNFRQQFSLSLLTLIIGGISHIRWLRHRGTIFQILISLIAIGLTIFALAQSLELMSVFALPVYLGFGGILFVVFMIVGLIKLCEATFPKSPRRLRSSTEVAKT